MQVTCPQCTTRLQLSAPKLPAHPFTIKCPKCSQGITVSPAAEASQPTEIESTPPPAPPTFAPPEESRSPEPLAPVPPPAPPAPPESSVLDSWLDTPAPPPVAARPSSDLPPAETNAAMGWTNSMPSPTVAENSNTLFTGQSANHDLLQALATLLGAQGVAQPTVRLEQHRRRSVVACLANAEELRRVEEVLDEQHYEIIAVASPEQVTSLLQTSNQLDILLLDPNFHAGQQGGATIMRYLNMLNPARRRRVFVVVMSHTYRTMDMQAAFMHGVNLILNSSDLDTLPQALTKSISEFNGLYRAFNQVSGLSAF